MSPALISPASFHHTLGPIHWLYISMSSWKFLCAFAQAIPSVRKTLLTHFMWSNLCSSFTSSSSPTYCRSPQGPPSNSRPSKRSCQEFCQISSMISYSTFLRVFPVYNDLPASPSRLCVKSKQRQLMPPTHQVTEQVLSAVLNISLLNKELALENGQRKKAGPKSYQLTMERWSGEHYKYKLPNGGKNVLHLLICHQRAYFRGWRLDLNVIITATICGKGLTGIRAQQTS